MNAILKSLKTYEERKRFWHQQLEKQKGSGLTQGAFCAQHQLNYKSFKNWKYRLSKHHQPTVPSGPPALSFVPVDIVGTGSSLLDERYLMVVGGFTLYIPPSFNQAALEQLLQMMRSLSC